MNTTIDYHKSKKNKNGANYNLHICGLTEI